MLNIVTIYAIQKTSTMPKTLKTLLLSLACSDVAVGLFSQPLYTFFLINWLRLHNPGCNYQQVRTILSGVFSNASFLGVVAVGVDRFLAVYFHLRYRELVTYMRVAVVVISVWLCSAFVSLMILWGPLSAQDFIGNRFCHHTRGVHQDISKCTTAQESHSVRANTKRSSV